jgi:hypothetical protein
MKNDRAQFNSAGSNNCNANSANEANITNVFDDLRHLRSNFFEIQHGKSRNCRKRTFLYGYANRL